MTAPVHRPAYGPVAVLVAVAALLKLIVVWQLAIALIGVYSKLLGQIDCAISTIKALMTLKNSSQDRVVIRYLSLLLPEL